MFLKFSSCLFYHLISQNVACAFTYTLYITGCNSFNHNTICSYQQTLNTHVQLELHKIWLGADFITHAFLNQCGTLNLLWLNSYGFGSGGFFQGPKTILSKDLMFIGICIHECHFAKKRGVKNFKCAWNIIREAPTHKYTNILPSFTSICMEYQAQCCGRVKLILKPPSPGYLISFIIFFLSGKSSLWILVVYS